MSQLLLCSLSTVKHMIGIEDEDTKHDSTIETIICGVSAQIQKYLGRSLLTTTYTETFNVKDQQTTFRVSAYPVTSVTSVKNDTERLWTTATVVAATSYDYTTLPGVIQIDYDTLAAGVGALQIVYVGGMATNTEELAMGDYADVSTAAWQQCVSVWNNRKFFGVSSASAGPQTVSPNGTKLLDSVKELLDPHRRRNV